jgi:hypothetical protein
MSALVFNLMGLLPSFHISRVQAIALVLAIVVLVPYYIITYRSERVALSPLRRGILIALRLTIAGFALLMIGRPTCLLIDREVHKPVLPILIDESKSMLYPDSREDPLTSANMRDKRRRFDGATTAAHMLSEKLAATHEVRTYLFSDTLRRLPESQDVAAEKPTGDYTHIGGGLCDLLADLSDRKLPAVVLASDGRQTGGRDVREAIALAKGAGIPIHTIMLGDEFPLRDLRIDEVSAASEVSLGDVLAINVLVVNQISSPLETTAKLMLGEKEIADKPLSLPRGSSRFTLYCIPEEVGEFDFRVVLPRCEDEVDYNNNEATIHVSVTKRSLKTLLVAGLPNIEYHYVVPALLRDPVVNLATYLQSADVDYVQQGKTTIEQLPKTLKEWEDFDVIILYDVDPNKLTAAQVSGIEHAVMKGRGLLFIAGRNFGINKLIQLQGPKIRALLPVDIEVKEPSDHEKLFDKPFHVWRTAQGRAHPVMLCEGKTETNDKIWQTFPTVYWYQTCNGLKPGAISLLELGAGENMEHGDPVMAVQRYGEGAVFYSGINSLWLWRFPYGSYDYDRFWSRVIRYLGESRLSGKQVQVALSTDKRVYAPGERARVRLDVMDPALSEQLADAAVYCKAKDAAGGEIMLKLARAKDGSGTYTVEYPAVLPGEIVLRVRQAAPGADSEAKPLFDVSDKIDVRVRSEEEIDTSGDMETMKNIAAQTGGKFYCYKNMRDLGALAGLISPEKEVLVRERAMEVWDTVTLLLVMFCLAAAEWCLRKLWGLL